MESEYLKSYFRINTFIVFKDTGMRYIVIHGRNVILSKCSNEPVCLRK